MWTAHPVHSHCAADSQGHRGWSLGCGVLRISRNPEFQPGCSLWTPLPAPGFPEISLVLLPVRLLCLSCRMSPGARTWLVKDSLSSGPARLWDQRCSRLPSTCPLPSLSSSWPSFSGTHPTFTESHLQGTSFQIGPTHSFLVDASLGDTIQPNEWASIRYKE